MRKSTTESDLTKGTVKAVCISREKGTAKRPVEAGRFIKDFGIEHDAHAGKWHRQVSLLSYDKAEEFNQKGAFVADGDFGENLAVKLDAFALHAVDQLAVVGTIEVSSVVDTGNPECAQIAFAVAAITVGITKGFNNTLLRKAEAASAIMLHTFSSLKNLFVLCASSDTTFNSHD